MAGAAAGPLIVSLAGLAAQYVGATQANKRRQTQIDALDRDRATFGEKNRALTEQLSSQYDPTTRKATLDSMVGKKADQIGADIAQANAALPEEKVAGNVSHAYDAGKAKTAASEAQRRVDLTRLLSKVLGPNDLRTEEGIKTADEGGIQSTLAANMRGIAGARNADVARIQPNPLLMYGGAGLQGLGSGLMASSYQDRMDKIFGGLFKDAPSRAKAITDISGV